MVQKKENLEEKETQNGQIAIRDEIFGKSDSDNESEK